MDAHRELRNALGKFATGITVITTRDENNNPVGMTVNSFASVSLTPPLVLWCLGEASSTCDAFLHCRHFAINILRADQQAISQLFASPGERQFEQQSWQSGPEGSPLLGQALAHFECSMEHQYQGGDHTIIVGRVSHFEQFEGEPLVFSQGQYRTLQGL